MLFFDKNLMVEAKNFEGEYIYVSRCILVRNIQLQSLNGR